MASRSRQRWLYQEPFGTYELQACPKGVHGLVGWSSRYLKKYCCKSTVQIGMRTIIFFFLEGGVVRMVQPGKVPVEGVFPQEKGLKPDLQGLLVDFGAK